MDTMFPCEEFHESECYPVCHTTHLECYNRYLLQQPGIRLNRCPICRQVTIGEMEWYCIADIFGFDADAVWAIDQLPREAYSFARSFQGGEISERQLFAMATALRPRDDLNS